MKNLLIILPSVPYPLESGGNISVFEMIDYLRFKLNISVVFPESPAVAELKEIWSNVNILSYKKGFKSRINRKLAQYFYRFFVKMYLKLVNSPDIDGNLKNISFFEINNDLISSVNVLLKDNKYDYIQIEFYELLPLISFLPKIENSIFIHHELRYIRNERTIISSNVKGGLSNFFLTQNKGQELEFLKLYDKIVTVSDVDKDLLSKELNLENIYSSPLAIRSNMAASNPYNFENTIFFLGGSTHGPNLNALVWFLEKCWPSILEKRSNLKFVIIGTWHEAHIRTLNLVGNIEFKGFVKDLKTEFKDGILVVPMKIGSGMRMKIIDAVNHGIPFITTRVGVEGLLFKDSVDCFIEDDPADFTAKLLILIEDGILQNLFIKNSKNVLHENYSYEAAVEKRLKIYE